MSTLDLLFLGSGSYKKVYFGSGSLLRFRFGFSVKVGRYFVWVPVLNRKFYFRFPVEVLGHHLYGSHRKKQIVSVRFRFGFLEMGF